MAALWGGENVLWTSLVLRFKKRAYGESICGSSSCVFDVLIFLLIGLETESKADDLRGNDIGP